MPPPIITLTTDFGLEDHYAGTMKGVLVSRCPDAKIIDISHQASSFSTLAGAYTIAQAAPYFPPGTVHVVVIDPGVGTARKGLLVKAKGQYFVAPDNGVLTLILAGDPMAELRAIANRALWLDPLSKTFHGRDIFAPVAASIASGTSLPEQIGPLVPEIVLLPEIAPVELEPECWRGKVLSVDHFGNIITNFPSRKFGALTPGKFRLTVASHIITEARTTFGEAEPNLCFAYLGSSGYLELGINQGSAARQLGVSPGNSLDFYFSS